MAPCPLLPPPPPLPPAASSGAPSSRPSPSTASQTAFHVAGVVFTAAAAVGALALFVLLVLGTSTTCDGDTTDPELVNELRIGVIVVAVGLAGVPALWALLARAGGFLAAPWAVLAGLVVAAGVGQAFSMHEVGTWCF